MTTRVESQVGEISREQDFGDLTLAFTTQYEYRWKDAGSGASADVAFWHPKAPEGFHALGSLGIRDYGSPDNRFASVCVKARQGELDKGPIEYPSGYKLIWKDSGSGAYDDGSCWRPIAPDGYVALGDVFVRGHRSPSTHDVVCVAEELTYPGRIGARTWIDENSGANQDFGAWQIEVRQVDDSYIRLAANTFTGRSSHEKPRSSDVNHVLKLSPPVEEFADPPPPTMDSPEEPPLSTDPKVDRRVTVPFTLIEDKNYEDVGLQVEYSPFYYVERYIYYSRADYGTNWDGAPDVSLDYAIRYGVSEKETETYLEQTGIEVSAKVGVRAGGFSTQASATLSQSLGYETSTSVTVFESTSHQFHFPIPAGSAAALYLGHQEIRVRRADGTFVGEGLSFDPHAFYLLEYPKRKSSDQGQGASLRRSSTD